MFLAASTFDQGLGNWDVSRGTSFVSNDKDIQFDLLRFQAGFRVKSITDVEGTSALNQSSFPLFSRGRMICLPWPLPLIRTSVAGM
jgi:hypothetical protein